MVSWKCYSMTKYVMTAQRVVERLEPWGVLVAILALVFAYYEFRLERNIREATLWVMVVERLEAARAAQFSTARVGQVPTLEAVVRSDLSLRNVDLNNIFLKDAQLQEAELCGANMTCTILVDTNLSHSDLRDVFAIGATFYNVCLLDTDFTDADLNQARFLLGTLEKANFTSANLEDARFRDVKLDGADFTDAQFRNTRFEKVDLSQVKGLTSKQMSRACGKEVVLPCGYSIEPCATKASQPIEMCGVDLFSWTHPKYGSGSTMARKQRP